jgi:hypothetical protein
MEDAELISLWKSYDTKLEKSLKLNMELIEEVKKQKMKSQLHSLVRLKIIEIILGLAALFILGSLLYIGWPQIFFCISVTALMVFCIVPIIQYLQQVALIASIDYNNNIVMAQQALVKLQASVINVPRFAWLQLPVYTLFYISNDMVKHGSAGFWVFQVLITGVFVFASVWLYKNISLKNINKRWIRGMIWNDGQKQVSKAMEFLKEIEKFRKECA